MLSYTVVFRVPNSRLILQGVFLSYMYDIYTKALSCVQASPAGNSRPLLPGVLRDHYACHS